MRRLLFLFFCLIAINSTAQGPAKTRWVDSVYGTLSEDERIGQLFMIAAYSGGPKANEPEVSALLKKGLIGGLIFMQGGPVRQAALTNKYQRAAKVPLLISMDAEWGLGMRLDSVEKFPRQMMLGAADDSLLVYRMGRAIAAQCTRLGVHINFAPVVDVNNNPRNPVINSRAFGEDKRRVARLGAAYARGLQDGGVMACAKHFPGHGDTDVDSHKDLPTIAKSRAALDTLELYPFRALFRAGVQSVMVAHLDVPSLEKTARLPTTLSYSTVTTLLKEELRFGGLVFTDALNMEGVAKAYAPGEVDLRAFAAGADVLLFSQDVPTAVARIKTAIAANTVTRAELERRVKKILAAKWDAGLHTPSTISTTGLTAALNKDVRSIRREATEAAVTLLAQNSTALTAVRTPGKRVLYVGVGATTGETVLAKMLRPTATRILPKFLVSGSAQSAIGSTAGFDAIVVALHGVSFTPAGNYGIDSAVIPALKKLATDERAVFVVLGNAYAMAPFCEAKTTVVTYEGDTVAERVAAEVLLGRRIARGRLPVSPCTSGLGRVGVLTPAAVGSVGISTLPVPVPTFRPQPLRPASAAAVGIRDSSALTALDDYLRRCVSQGAFPGCRVLAAKDGAIFYDRSVGRAGYTGATSAVTTATLYDLASLTKVLSTTLAVMKLEEEGKLSIDKTVGFYLPWTRGTDKAGIRLRDLLLHQAGLVAYIPFWKGTVDSTGWPGTDYYRSTAQKDYRIEVAQGLYLRNDYPDSMWAQILLSPLGTPSRYLYSDNDFYFLWAVVERVAKKKLDAYVTETFYKPMGLRTLSYSPVKKVRLADVAPTEDDGLFRHRLIHGHVHDQGAAMMGGVAGHAGLFGTAGDVAAIMQMVLNGGAYNGVRYFKSATVARYTGYGTSGSRRGLGWDKPAASDDASSTSDRCSGYTFGHQGFTGTCAWADPATGVVFVFLSNRVHPNADNGAINRLGVRTEVQDRLYQALGIPKNKERAVVRRVQVGG